MESQGDGFQLSDVQGSLKALPGGAPGREVALGDSEGPASWGELCSSP